MLTTGDKAEQEQKAQEDVDMEDDDDNFIQVEGVLVKHDFEQLVMDEQEVSEYTGLKCAHMQQSLFVPFAYNIEVLAYFFASYYPDVQTSFRKVP